VNAYLKVLLLASVFGAVVSGSVWILWVIVCRLPWSEMQAGIENGRRELAAGKRIWMVVGHLPWGAMRDALRSEFRDVVARELYGPIGGKASVRYTTRVPTEFDLDDRSHVELLIRIRSAFAASLQEEAGPYGQCLYKPASTLAYSKDAIRTALTALLDFAEGRRTSTLLDVSLRSRATVETICMSLACLDNYLELSTSDLPASRVENILVGGEYEQRRTNNRVRGKTEREFEALHRALAAERAAETRFVGGPGTSVPAEIVQAIQATDAAFRVLYDTLGIMGQGFAETCEALGLTIAAERRQSAHSHTAPRVTFLRGAIGNAIYFARHTTDTAFVTLGMRLGIPASSSGNGTVNRQGTTSGT